MGTQTSLTYTCRRTTRKKVTVLWFISTQAALHPVIRAATGKCLHGCAARAMLPAALTTRSEPIPTMPASLRSPIEIKAAIPQGDRSRRGRGLFHRQAGHGGRLRRTYPCHAVCLSGRGGSPGAGCPHVWGGRPLLLPHGGLGAITALTKIREEANQGAAGLCRRDGWAKTITVEEIKSGAYLEKMKPISAVDWERAGFCADRRRLRRP